ncbi:hypothetical protein DL98DRAFT_584822 [Cadophora sp. DSE1049]|nr:hypothetical protein DL98DRAFT_584822 [Cadophora sp. DSE1049]
MSVALSNGASVVAFIGLSINALRGLHYLYDVIENVKGAPQELQCIYFQLRFFQLSFSTFQHSLEEAVKLGVVTPLDVQTRLAIDDAQDTIKLFQKIVYRYGEGRAIGLRTRMKIAMRKTQLASLSRRLEKISEQVHATHCGITMLGQNHQHRICVSNSAELDRNILMLHESVSKNMPNTMTEKLQTINHAVDDLAESILKLISNLSQSNDGQLLTSQRSATDARKMKKDSGCQFTEEDLVAQLTAHVAASIRATVTDVQHNHFLAAGRSLALSELDALLRQVLIKHDQKYFSSGLSPSQSWNRILRTYDLLLGLIEQAQFSPLPPLNMTHWAVETFKQCSPLAAHLSLKLLPLPYTHGLETCLAIVMKSVCLLESLLYAIDQVFTRERRHSTHRRSRSCYDDLSTPSTDIICPRSGEDRWFRPSLLTISEILIEPSSFWGHFESLATCMAPTFDGYSQMTCICSNITTMFVSEYEKVIEPLPYGDCILIHAFSSSWVSPIDEMSKDEDLLSLSEPSSEHIPHSYNLSSMVFPAFSLLLVASFGVSKYRVSKFITPLCKIITAFNCMRIVMQLRYVLF